MKNLEKKQIANAAGATIGRPHFEEMAKKQKGITLIALIITIIVMMILVGVTVNVALNGGLFKTASGAAKDTQKEADREELQASVAGAYNAVAGTVDGTKLQSNLSGWTIEGTGPYTCTSKNGNKFTVSTNGKITPVEEKQETPVEKVTDENPGELSGAGTEENPYLIASIEDLVVFLKAVNVEGTTYEGNTLSLETTLDFASDNSYVDPSNTTYGDINGNGTVEGLKTECTTGEGIVTLCAIDISSMEVDEETGMPLVGFAGILDGNNNEIRNFYVETTISTTSEIQYGVTFILINKGTIKNLGLDADLEAISESENAYIMVVGLSLMNLGTESNCYVMGSIINNTTSMEAAGFNYYNVGTITRCYNSAEIINLSGGTASGIVYNNAGSIDQSFNSGRISGRDAIGISNYNEGTIINCYNVGDLKGETVSGIVWNAFEGSKTMNCYNAGSLTGDESWDEGTFDTYGCGIVSGTSDSGAILIENCYNLGNINAHSEVAGVLREPGKNQSEIVVKNCHNRGTLNIIGTTTNYTVLAGIVPTTGCTVTNCSYLKGTLRINGQIQTDLEDENAKQESEMPDVLTVLNTVEEGETAVFKADTENINNGYPIFTWQ